jgi:hypothetical protein
VIADYAQRSTVLATAESGIIYSLKALTAQLKIILLVHHINGMGFTGWFCACSDLAASFILGTFWALFGFLTKKPQKSRSEVFDFAKKFLERATGIEPVTSSLGSWHSTAELRPLKER